MLKKIIAISLMLCGAAYGIVQYELEYGVAATIDFPLFDSNSPWALYETAPATADVNIFRDQGASESSDNLVVDEGPFMSLTISAAEMTAKTITVVIKDATSPRAYMDQVILITTSGDASALYGTVAVADVFSDALTAANVTDDMFADANWTDLVHTVADIDANIGAAGLGLTAIPGFGGVTLDDVNTALVADIAGVTAAFDFADANWTDLVHTVADIDANTILILADTSAMDTAAEMKTLVWDSNMVDMAAGAPDYDWSIFDAINWMYALSRNQTWVTSTEITVYKNDASTILSESTISDDGTTFKRGEYRAEN